MDANEISVARLLELAVPVSWQEAVSIASEVSTERGAGPTLGQPPFRVTPESCLLTWRGDIVLGHGPHPDETDADVQLLRALLVGREIPNDLSELVWGTPPTHLGDALAIFSRPNRRADIATVALRGIEAEAALARSAALPVAPPSDPQDASAPVASASNDLDHLRARVNRSAETAPSIEAAPLLPTPLNRRPALVNLLAAGVAALITGGGLWAWWTTGPAMPAPPAAELPAALQSMELGSWWYLAGQREGDVELGAGVAARPRQASPGDIALSVSGLGGAVSSSPTASAACPAAPPAAAPEGGAGAPAGEPPLEAERTVPLVDDAVYSWRNLRVEPPVMTHPRMPRGAFPTPDVTLNGPYVEVLVGQSGQVEAVRFQGHGSNDGRSVYRYGMMLSAAKAWQFTPAHLNGQPVRYVTRVILAP